MVTAEISAAITPHIFKQWKTQEKTGHKDLSEEYQLIELFNFSFVMSISILSLFSVDIVKLLFNKVILMFGLFFQ